MKGRESSGLIGRLRGGAVGYVLLLVIALLLKQHFSAASVDDLDWILSPTSSLVSQVTGTTFVKESGVGYVSHDGFVAIVKGCAGVNYMIILFLLLGFPFVAKQRGAGRQCLYVGSVLLLSYGLTLFVNTLRIILAIFLFKEQFYTGFFTVELMHTLEGIVVYFGSLLIIFPLFQRVIGYGSKKKKETKISLYLPFSVYFLVTILIPFVRSLFVGAAMMPLSHFLLMSIVPLFLIMLMKLSKRGGVTHV